MILPKKEILVTTTPSDIQRRFGDDNDKIMNDFDCQASAECPHSVQNSFKCRT